MQTPAANTVSEFFEQDHRAIDAILAGVRYAEPADAERFAEFDRRLERHIVWEEEILFPAVAAREPGLAMGPLRVMRLEHERIRAAKAAALAALRAGRWDEARAAAQDMAGVLAQHNMKEEHVLYPAADEALAGPEAQAVLARVRAG